MGKNRDRRLNDLEHDMGGGDEIRVSVNWRDDGLVLDHDTGKYISPDTWRKRHPKDKLIIVSAWDKDDDDYTA